ncbi:MAG: hypothetical protein Q9215_006690 [Flavoplaca cf. flavocitrina]
MENNTPPTGAPQAANATLSETLGQYKLPVLCDQGAGKDAENLWGAADNALYIRSLIQDLLGIPEEHTWEYSEALAKTIEEKGFDRLDLRRVMDVIGFTDQEPITKQNYLSLTHRSREVLMQKYGKTEDDIKALINTDHDILMTYRGFIRFLETDFSLSTNYFKIVAPITSAYPFTRRVEQPSGEFAKAPWHCVVAMDIHGSYRTVHAREVRKTHNLVYVDGRPQYYRQKSSLWDWEESRTGNTVVNLNIPMACSFIQQKMPN